MKYFNSVLTVIAYFSLLVVWGFTNNILAQDSTISHGWPPLDSLIWKNPQPQKTYPYKAIVDSIMTDRAEFVKDLPDSIIIDFFEPCPNVYYIDESGKQLSNKEFQKLRREFIPKDCKIILLVEADWTGKIREVRILEKTCHLPKTDFKGFIKNIKIKPDTTLFGFPYPEQTKIAFLFIHPDENQENK